MPQHPADGPSAPPHAAPSPPPSPPPRPPAPAGLPDDALLTVRAGEGDEDAFETLVRRHGQVLLQLAQRLLGNRADAEDAVQDSFVNAWRRLPEFRGDSAFLTWMYRIVTNRCLNLLRSRRPVTDLDSLPEPAAPEHATSPARAAESSAALDALYGVLSQLPAEQRACWVLRELHGLSYDDIAAAVGISRTAVRGRIFRVRRYLTEAMGPWR